VAGWGLPTMKGITYTEEHGALDYKPVFTTEGDETVVYASAISSNNIDENYYLNLSLLNKNSEEDFSHYNLLSANQVQEVLRDIFDENVISDSEIDYVSDSKPLISESDTQLLVSAHSPILLGVHDSLGNFTGIDSETEEIIEEIPGSSFQVFGQSQYIFLPKSGVYNFTYQGTGTGPATIEVELFSDDTAIPVTYFSDIKTTDTTKASFTVNATNPETVKIAVDADGNGSIDEVVLPDGSEESEPPKPPKPPKDGPTLAKLLSALDAKIKHLPLTRKAKQDITHSLTQLKKQAAHNKPQALKTIAIMQKQLQRAKKGWGIPRKEINEILKLLKEIKNLL